MTRKCCCFDVRSGTFVAITFTLTISAVQFLLVISLFGGFGLAFVFANDSNEPYYTSLAMYIGLALFDIIMIIISAVALNANQKGRRTVLIIWMFILGIYMLFEAGVNITFFIFNFESYLELLDLAGNLTVIGLIFYWIIKVIVYIVCMYTVGNRWAELDDHKEPHEQRQPKRRIIRRSRRDTNSGDRIRVVNLATDDILQERIPPQSAVYQSGPQMYHSSGVNSGGIYGETPTSVLSPSVLTQPVNYGGQYVLRQM